MKLTQTEIAMFRSRLLRIIAGDVPDRKFGLCHQLTYYPDEYRGASRISGYDFVAEFAQDFEPALRDSEGKLINYFVPRSKDFGLWGGPNLKRRKALCSHLLDKLAKAEAVLAG